MKLSAHSVQPFCGPNYNSYNNGHRIADRLMILLTFTYTYNMILKAMALSLTKFNRLELLEQKECFLEFSAQSMNTIVSKYAREMLYLLMHG